MKYTEQERLAIGKRIYDGEINRFMAAEIYHINSFTARDYMRLYRHTNHLPEKKSSCKTSGPRFSNNDLTVLAQEQKSLEEMSREELIDQLVLARINESRLKKGYQVKGVGANKVYIPLDSKNTK